MGIGYLFLFAAALVLVSAIARHVSPLWLLIIVAVLALVLVFSTFNVQITITPKSGTPQAFYMPCYGI